MSSSFESTAFQSAARPVDTFVAPPQYDPISDIEGLSKILSAINPALNKFFATRMEKAAEQERADINLEIGKKGFKTIAKEHRDQHGDNAANRLIGGSIFADDEFDKVKTQLLGDTYTNEAQSLYNSKTYEITTTSGTTITVPITHFPIESPQYQSFLEEVSGIGANLAGTTKGKYLTDYFYPAQSKIVKKITEEHIDAHNDFNFNKLSKQSFPVITSAYLKYQDGDKENALDTINNFVNNKVLLGITQDKQTKYFDNLLEYTKSLRDEAYTVDGMDGSNNVLAMMRGIKYGPNGASIFETHPKFLSEMHKQTIKHIKDKDAIDEINNKNKQEEAETGILQLVNELGIEEGDLPYSTIERIRAFGSKYGVSVDWIDEKIDIFQPQRISKLKDFSFTLTEGTYIGRPVEATKQLGKLLNSLGPLTDEEDKIKTKIVSQIESSRKGQTEGSQAELNTIIQRLRKQINPSYDSLQQVYELMEGEKDPTPFMLDLERELNRDFKTWLLFTDDDGDGVFDTRTANEINTYLVDAEDKAINKIKKWQGGSDDPDGPITLPGEVFKGLSQNDAYEQITIDGQQALKNKESGEVYVSDEIIDTGGESSGFTGDPLFKGRPEPSVASEITQEDIDREKALDAAQANAYIVQAGDTLTSVAESFGTRINDIMEANNNITNPNVIEEGQELIMPIGDAVGDAVVPESDLTNRSVLDEIDVTKAFNYNSLYRLAMEVGFPPEDARIMAAIALAESKGDAQIDTVASGTDPNKENEFSLGLWQINVIKEYQEERFPLFNIKSPQDLYDPLTNAKAAFILYDRRKPEQRFNDWSTYTDGTYKDFLPKTN